MCKHSKVYSSTEWRLREKVILRLIECLISSVSLDIFMDNYFTFFRLLIHLEVNNIRATRVLKKNRLRKCIGDKQLQKKKRGHFEQRTFLKKQSNFDSGWLEQQQCDFHRLF